MDIVTLVKELAAGGFATFLVAILVAGRYRVWVWGPQYDDMLKEKNEQIVAILAEKNTQFDNMVKEKNAQLELERKRGDRWEAMAMGLKSQVERTVEVVGKAVGA